MVLTLDLIADESTAHAPLNGTAVAPIARPNAPHPPFNNTSLLGSSIFVFCFNRAIFFLPFYFLLIFCVGITDDSHFAMGLL